MVLRKAFFVLAFPSPLPILAKQLFSIILTSEGHAGIIMEGEFSCLTFATENSGIHPLVLLTLNVCDSVNNGQVMNF